MYFKTFMYTYCKVSFNTWFLLEDGHLMAKHVRDAQNHWLAKNKNNEAPREDELNSGLFKYTVKLFHKAFTVLEYWYCLV